MDKTLREVGILGLNGLRQSAKADSMTCHFYNPFSDVIWLFHKDGSFRYDCQVHGPLTHPDQSERFKYGSGELCEGYEITFFSQMPAPLLNNVLAGESFAKREGLVQALKIRLFDPEHENQPEVFIFLNYRSPQPIAEDGTLNRLKSQLNTLHVCLIRLAAQPRLTPEVAWRLRGVNLKFRQRLGDSLVLQGAKYERDRDELYDFIVKQALRLLDPLSGKNLFCTLSLVDVENRVTTVAKTPDSVTIPQAAGIVEYVSRTGQMYFIDDVDTYQARWKETPNDASLPKYVECDPQTKCELACPLIVQRKVVGVINVEADTPRAFDDEHVLLLYQFSTTAALVVRQVSLWNDLNEAIQHQRDLLGCKSDDFIFEKTVEAVARLGYRTPAIWDTKKNTWHQLPSFKERRKSPRADGFTRWIVENRQPVALADLRSAGPANVVFDWHLGRLDQDSRFFEGWVNPTQPIPNTSANDEVIAIVGGSSTVYTDLGFPIFSGAPGEEEKVRAVLWAKCPRYFRSLLNDESWCLALLCRNAGEALKVWHNVYSMGSDSRKVSLAHRFGEKRVDCLLKLLDRDSTALSAKPVDDVIVLHVDIRGSRQLEARLAEVRQQDKYADFIREYHEMARQKIIEFGGVFDKTMGDGIQAIFNVFRISAVSVEPFDSLEVTKCSAVKCAVAIFDLFSELVDRFRRRVFHAAPPQGFCLGAGLTIGRGYLGSFSSPPSVPGFEFSIHGEAGNRAGTLVGLARGQNLANGIRSAHQQDKLNVLRVFPGSETSRAELANDEVERLTRFIEEGVRSLLLMAPDFESARLPDNLEYYMFAADGAAMSILTWSKAAGTLDLGKPVP